MNYEHLANRLRSSTAQIFSGTRAGLAPAAVIGDSGKPRAGEMVIAVGNAFGFTGAVSAGVLHSVGPLPVGPRRNWVQADVRLGVEIVPVLRVHLHREAQAA